MYVRSVRPRVLLLASAASVCIVMGAGGRGAALGATPGTQGIHKIQHVVVIMQENRSFDSYFGTFPRANGIPMAGGHPTVCVPDPRSGQCVAPYHDPGDVNHGGPHGQGAAFADINGGGMNGVIAQAQKAGTRCTNPNNPPFPPPGATDLLGYHHGGPSPDNLPHAH